MYSLILLLCLASASMSLVHTVSGDEAVEGEIRYGYLYSVW